MSLTYITPRSRWRIKLVYAVLVLTALVYAERRLIETRLTGARLSALTQAALVYTVLVYTECIHCYIHIPTFHIVWLLRNLSLGGKLYLRDDTNTAFV